MAVDNRAASVPVDDMATAAFKSWRDSSCAMITYESTLFKEVPRVVQDYMGVGATKAESIDRYAPQTRRRPWNTPVGDLKSGLAQ